MAPKSGTKRAAQASKATQPAKVQKKHEEKKVEAAPTISDPLLEGLLDVVSRSELPPSCKEMLRVMIPNSFTMPAAERHKLQAIAVRMVGEVIEQMHGQMSKEFEEATAALEAAEAKKSSLDTSVAEAESQLTAAGETVQAKDSALQDATRLTSEKQTMLDTAKEIQVKGDAEFKVVKEEEQRFQTAFTGSFEVLHSSDLEGFEANQHYKTIEPLLAKLELEDSLTMALPSTCQKKLCDRGSFDNVIMEQVGKKLKEHIAGLQQKIESGTPGVAERASGVQAAKEELDEAEACKENAKEELRIAQDSQTKAVQVLESAKTAVNDFKVVLENATRERDSKMAVRAEFENWNIDCFNELKNKTSAPKETPEPADAIPPKAMLSEEAKDVPVAQAGA